MAYIDTKEAAKVFVSSTFAGIFTDAFVNGLSDPVKPLNKANAVFNGLQLGTNFIAYPVAQRILHDNLKIYRKKEKKMREKKKESKSLPARKSPRETLRTPRAGKSPRLLRRESRVLRALRRAVRRLRRAG